MKAQAQALLRAATGLNLAKSAVDRAVRQRMDKLDAADSEVYLDRITADELAQLVELVVVPESWLFRDAQAFAATVEFVRERLAQTPASGRPRALRILSLPCAAGEEPYSIAMALCDAAIPPAAFSIDAYDISAACVRRAQAGIYGQNAFRSQDLGFRARHFNAVDDNSYQINDAIRQLVRFKQGNLLTLEIADKHGYYDVIFCRNLLIYFDQPTTRAAIERLTALLADDGVLFAGYAEVPSFCQYGYTPIRHPQAFGLKKECAPQHAVAARARTPKAAVRKPAAPPAMDLATTAAAKRRAPAAPRATTALPQTTAATPAVDLLAQARKLADQGHYADAEAACRAHLAQQPDAAEAYFILGLLSEQASQHRAADEHWRRCIYLQPDHYEALCHLALLAEQHKDMTAATAFKARAARIYRRLQNPQGRS